MAQLLFNSIPFIFLFMPVSFILYWGTGLLNVSESCRGKLRKLILCAVSILFYASFGVRIFLLFGISILINTAAIVLYRRRNSGKVLIAGVIFNILYLCFFKYYGAFTGRSIVFPIGISFYTFQQISFLLDLKDGECSIEGLSDYFLYILYFPKLLEGPIVRYKELSGSFKTLSGMKLKGRGKQLFRAGVLFLLGLSKKVLIADTLSNAVDIAFSNTASLYWADAVILFFTYLPSLYFDFSGYCDMGMAISEFFGIPLPYNFDRPFLATNVVDFWQRWHSSLSRFFTRYIYIPMGGSRKGIVRTCFNSFLIFFISGLWHGVGLTFIVWGCMHGGLYVVTRLIRERRKKKRSASSGGPEEKRKRIPGPIRSIPMYLYAAASFVFFRASTMEDALNVFRKIFSEPWPPMTVKFVEGFERNEIWYVIKMTPLGNYEWSIYICMWMMLALAYGLTFLSPKAGDLADRAAEKIVMNGRGAVLTGILLGILFSWCVLSLAKVASFAYFNF